MDVSEKKKIVHQFSKTDLVSIENVCNFINNNSEPNLMELPGLKMKQRIPVPVPIHEQIPSALRLKIFIHEEKVLKTTLKSKDMTVAQLSSLVFHKLKLSESESNHFCLCRRSEDEFMFLPSSDKLLDHNTNMFYLRLVKPLNNSLRTRIYDSKFDVRNCGNFAFKGRSNKKADSSCIKMVVNSSGLEINCDFILWKYVSQVSYSNTFLQILYKHNQCLSKKKVCFETEKIKPIYNLIMFYMEMEKVKRAQEAQIKAQEIVKVETEAPKTKEDETKFENFWRKICNQTKDAVKNIGTPRRKRSKSIDSHQYQKPKKTKSLNRSLSSADMNRVKRNILEDFQESSKSPKIPMATSTPTKRKSETHLEQLPMKRTKIVTNPHPQPSSSSSSSSSSTTSQRKTGRTPVRMGVRSVAPTKPTVISSLTPTTSSERKIFYTTGLKTDFSFYNISLKSSPEAAVFIDNIEKLDNNCKFRVGDRLLAINGISLENCALDKVEFLLENAGHFVNFIISRKL